MCGGGAGEVGTAGACGGMGACGGAAPDAAPAANIAAARTERYNEAGRTGVSPPAGP